LWLPVGRWYASGRIFKEGRRKEATMSSSTSGVSTVIGRAYINEYDAIVETMNRYNEGVRTGNSSVMKPAFHETCTFYGYVNGTLLAGPIQLLFDWVDGNGAASDVQIRFASIDILETIASVRLEMENMTGKLAGPSPSRLSDLFQLIKVDGEWLISQKSFQWHVA
jgi:hypothetical protein